MAATAQAVSTFVGVRDVGRFRAVCRAWSEVRLGEGWWRRRAQRERGRAFWDAAHRRPARASRPLGSWELELRRLARFDALCRAKLGRVLPNHTFHLMWCAMDAAPQTGPYNVG